MEAAHRIEKRVKSIGHQLKNSFGILTSDLQAIESKGFKKFLGEDRFKPADLSKSLGIGRTTLYEKRVKVSREFIKEKLIPIALSAEMAADILGNMEKGRLWVLTPNSYFFGKSPFEVCLLGDGRAVLELLQSRLGELSGEEKNY